MKEHELKCWPVLFQAMIDGKKSFEFRKNDRDFKSGDRIKLREYDLELEGLLNPENRYTGRHMIAIIKSVWMDLPNLPKDYCIMDILVVVPLGKEYARTIKLSKFWKKVLTCSHEWDKNYSAYLRCNTPHCSGAESKCKKCRIYSSTCGCGSENGLSGWPERRWQDYYTKWMKKRLAKQMKGV